MVSSALENEGVKRLLTELETQIQSINDILLNSTSDDVDDKMRDRLIDQKKILTRVTTYFTNAPEEMKSLEKEIDNNL